MFLSDQIESEEVRFPACILLFYHCLFLNHVCNISHYLTDIFAHTTVLRLYLWASSCLIFRQMSVVVCERKINCNPVTLGFTNISNTLPTQHL